MPKKGLERVKFDPSKVDRRYYPKSLNPKEKTKFTEGRLQELQKDLFQIFGICKKTCDACPMERKCEMVVSDMAYYLSPYGASIYKGSYKKRSTLEEMYRVIYESINSLLMDVWHKDKKIHTSFGSMLKFKMLHYLDGKINLFDTATKSYTVESLDSLIGKLDGHSGSNATGQDVIEYTYSAFQSPAESNKGLFKGATIDAIMGIVESAADRMSKFLSKQESTSLYLKALIGVKRFFEGKHNYVLYKDDPKARVYYIKILDEVFEYLDYYKRIK